MYCNQCGNEVKGHSRFCTNCGKENCLHETLLVKKIKAFFSRKYFVIACFVLLVIFIGVISLRQGEKFLDRRQQSIASSVVNIYCEGVSGWENEDVSGGSGTIVTAGGLVLTNAHIVPQGNEASLNKESCIVVLPNPIDGSGEEVYYGEPYIVDNISKKYDLAFIQITDVYYNEEEGKAYGEYPKVFPAYDSDLYCKNEEVKLGESVRIYGYPAISGGYALTITDGIVSSLLREEGYIITSAKISHGNSGGLAVDENGCRIGIPSMVSSDDSESLGVIISNNLIHDFINELDSK